MPSGSRHRFNAVFGAITDNPLTAGAITFNSPGLADMGVVAPPDHAIVTLDPLKEFGAPEIIIVTVHTAAATVATITRGAYGTTARSHPQGTLWVHAPLDEDFIEIVTAATRPSNPYRGQTIFESDTNRYIGRSTADIWQGISMFSDPPAVRVTPTGTQSINNNSLTILTLWDTEVYDTASMWSAGAPSTITITVSGLYLVTANIEWSPETDYTETLLLLELGSGSDIMQDRQLNSTTNLLRTNGFATVIQLVATQTVQLAARQQNTSANAETVDEGHFSATWIGRG